MEKSNFTKTNKSETDEEHAYHFLWHQGVVYKEFVSASEIVNFTFYCTFLWQLCENVQRLRKENVLVRIRSHSDSRLAPSLCIQHTVYTVRSFTVLCTTVLHLLLFYWSEYLVSYWPFTVQFHHIKSKF